MISDQLGQGEAFARPFPYYSAPQALTEEGAEAVLTWLENDAPWILSQQSFYEQYELNFANIELPPSIAPLVAPENLSRVRRLAAEAFGVELEDKINFVAHKLVPGQRIRVHNDYQPEPGGITHRLLIQLNRDWRDQNGGMLVFYNSSDAKDIHKVFRPLHNSCVAFAISEDSFHAVSTIKDGQRYTLVFSFYQRRPA